MGASGQALSLMTDRDARSLAEIEKLTRRTLPVEDLMLPEVATAERGRPRERGRDRDDRDGRPDRGERRGSSEGRREGRGGERAGRGGRAPIDPLFSQPYVPSEASEAAETEARPSTTRAGQRPRKIAVLLGGKPPARRDLAPDP